uniref:Ig-like domain-containing protein n=1 Tax=Panthera leo TaxID=9689 RepID=A0A8C8WL70_PANLE
MFFPCPSSWLAPIHLSVSVQNLSFTAGQPFISLTGPSRRTTPGNPVPFNCTAGPFSSWDFNVTWMKGSDEHPASAQHLVTNNQGNYFVTSKVWVTLTLQDLLLEITCEVTHRALGEPLRKTMNLSQVLQVVPTLKITTKTSGTYIHVQQRVNLTCHASHFYPSHLRLTWMENRHQVHTVESPQVTRNPDGTYSLKHTWQAEATLDGSEFACWVVQDEQPPFRANITLRAQPRKLTYSYSLQGPLQRSEPGKSIQLTYVSSGFPSRHITVTWFKKNHELPKTQTYVHPSGDTHNVTSRVLVPLQADDVLSFVQCHVSHKSTLVFQKAISLDQYLRVPPTVTVSQSSPSSDLVVVTCLVQRFYPQSVHLTWTENCHTIEGAEQLTSKQNSDGTYTLESLHLVNVSGPGSEQVLTCKVQHETQPPIQASLILSAEAHGTYKPIGSSDACLIFVAFLLGFKVLLAMSFIVTYICRWRSR